MIELEQAGANLLATDQQGNTCLHLAARFGHKDIVKFLIEAAPPAILDMADHEKWDFKILIFWSMMQIGTVTVVSYFERNLVVWNISFVWIPPSSFVWGGGGVVF